MTKPANKSTFENAPWTFIIGPDRNPGRVTSIRPHKDRWTCFAQVTVSQNARSLSTKKMYHVTGVPAHLEGIEFVALKRICGQQAHLVAMGATQEALLLLLGTIDPDSAVKVDLALSGKLPVKKIGDHFVVGHDARDDLPVAKITNRETMEVQDV